MNIALRARCRSSNKKSFSKFTMHDAICEPLSNKGAANKKRIQSMENGKDDNQLNTLTTKAYVFVWHKLEIENLLHRHHS